MAYGKSFSNNYLEQKRVNNHNADSYMCVECDFPAIIDKDDWERCQKIKESRIRPSLQKAIGNRKKNATHGAPINHDLWCNKLICGCGARFRKQRWHKNKGKPWSYGYQCYNQLNNGSAKQRREAGADDTGYCDQPMIADWKLNMMGKMIMEQIWKDKKETVQFACELIEQCYRSEKPKVADNTAGLLAQIERLKSKKERLIEMRTDGDISKDDFRKQKDKIDADIAKLTDECEKADTDEVIRPEDTLCWEKIHAALNELIDLSQPTVSQDILDKFVSKVVPESKTHYRWYLNLDGNDDTIQDMVIDGRKNHAVVTFGTQGTSSPLHIGEIISFLDLKKASINKKHRPFPVLHRLP